MLCAGMFRLALSTILFVFFSLVASGQELDETRQFRLPAKAPLHWENVYNGGQYIRGIQPSSTVGRQIAKVKLLPGEATEFFVPAHEIIRVVSCDGTHLSEQEVEVWNSNGTGLYRRQVSAIAKDGRSMISAPDQANISTAKVYRPATATGPLCVSIYTSRRIRPELLDYYQCRVSGLGASVEISDDNATVKQNYNLLAENTNCEVPVNGPTRLRLEARLQFGNDYQQRQSFWLQVYLDGVLHRIYTFDTVPQKLTRVFVDGCEKLVGRREFAYVDIDQDAKIEIKSSHPVYLRVDGVGLNLCRPQWNRNLDLPTWQNSQKSISNWNAPEFDPASAALNQSFLYEDENTRQQLADPLFDPYLNQQRIHQIARDNQIQHSGLRAYMWIRALATMHYGDSNFRGEISIPDMAKRIRERYTFFRDLLPAKLDNHREPRRVSFPMRQIRKVRTQRLTETIVGEQHAGEAASWLPTTTLFRCSTVDEPVLRYRVPRKLGTSLLRVVVDQTHLQESVRLMVQYDDRVPIQMAIHCQDALPNSAFIPSRPEAAIASLNKIYERYNSGPVGGPFGVWSNPQPTIKAATDELLLPSHIREVKIWLESDHNTSVHVGLQYMDARPFQLSESSYKRISLLEQFSNNTAEQAFASRELENHTLALQRLLIAHSLHFTSSLERSDQVSDPTDIWDNDLVEQQFELAKSLANQLQWAGAIEALSKVIDHSTGESRNSAIVARIHALESMGENFLAKLEKHGWLQFSPNEALRQSLLEMLIQENEVKNPELHERDLAFVALQQEDEIHALRLSRQLLENGKHEYALLVLPSFKATPATEDIILRCSFQMQWWQLFDETVNGLGDERKQSLWKGLKEMRLGRFRKAHGLLQTSAELGQDWLRHWEQGHLIFQRLSNSNFAARMSAMEEWENWQRNHPGDRHWTALDEAIQECVGTESVYNQIRDIRTQFYLANPEQPGKLCVHGPVRIKLECRPIHAANEQRPLQDWLRIVNGESVSKIPIINNYGSRMLTLEGNPQFLPGQRVVTEIDLPAGLNCLELFAEKSNLLFRVQVERPEIQSPVLPVINEATLAAVVKGDFGKSDPCCEEANRQNLDNVRLICRDRNCCSIPLAFQGIICGCNEFHTAKELFLKTATGDTNRWRDRFEPAFKPIVIEDVDEFLTEAMEAAKASQVQSNSAPQERMLAIATLYRLVIENPNREDIQQLLEQAKLGTRWERFNQFDRQAGVHSRQVSTWQPENPALRVRKALSGIRNAEYVVTGSRPVAIELQNQTSGNVQLKAQRPRISFMPTAPSVVTVAAGDLTEEFSLEEPSQVFQETLHLDPNVRQVSFISANPLANHFVTLGFNETLNDGTPVPDGQRRTPLSTQQRTYQVATEDEPLEFRVAGPTIVRIDWIQDGQTWTDTIPVTDEQANFRLTPQGNAEMTHFRIFELVNHEDSIVIHRPSAIPSRIPDDWVHEIVNNVYERVSYFDESQPLDMLALRSPDSLPEEINLFDHEHLGLQEFGTWSLDIGYRERRALDEFPNPSQPGRFMEAVLTRNFYNEWNDIYSQNEFLVRPRINGGTTFGARHSGSTTIPFAKRDPNSKADGWGPYTASWNLFGFAQDAETAVLPGATSTPWTLGFNGRLSRQHRINECFRHQPTISYYGRLLSEDFDGFSPGELDQDIFTPYKADHRYGLRFSDRFVYQNCLDKRVWFRPSLNTNEDQLVPDNLGFQFGTDQLLGPLQLQLSYRLTGYLADNDRSNSSVQNVIDVNLMLERWHNRNRRSELKFGMRHDLGNGGTSIGFNLVNFVNHGRGYRDFDSMLFGSIREERAAKHLFFNP